MVERKELPNDIKEAVQHRTLSYRERHNEVAAAAKKKAKVTDKEKAAMNAALTARRRAIEEHQTRLNEEDSEWLSEKNITA